MFYRVFSASSFRRSCFSLKISVALIALAACLAAPPTNAFAQSFKSELETAEKVSLLVTSRNGRVSVIASDDQQKKVTIEATSSGLPVDPGDVVTVAKGASINIDVRPRREQDRIDVVVRIPSRSKVVVETQGGSVDVVGNLENAQVRTNTGTIHADVPLDAVKFSFEWAASRPRYLSDVELPEMKEPRRRIGSSLPSKPSVA